MSELRCSDCLSEFGGDQRFAVVLEDLGRHYNDEERRFGAHLYQVLVCESCAEWYPDTEVMEVPHD